MFWLLCCYFLLPCRERLSSRPPSEIAETASLAALARSPPNLLPRARRLKPRALVRVRGHASHDRRRAENNSGGADRSRVALGARSTARRLRVWVIARCPAPAQITNTLAGYRTAELSDSPRASVMPPVPPCRVEAGRAADDAESVSIPPALLSMPWGGAIHPRLSRLAGAAPLARNSAASALSRPPVAVRTSTLLSCRPASARRRGGGRRSLPWSIPFAVVLPPTQWCAPRSRSWSDRPPGGVRW